MVTHKYLVRVVPERQQLECELLLSGLSSGPLLLATPTWVPGAYSEMKYGRDLFEVRAFAGARELPTRREGWSGFSVDAPVGELRVTWRALGYDPAWGELSGLVDHQYAVLRGTRYLFAPAHPGPCEVRYEVPQGWPIHHPAGAEPRGHDTWTYPSFLALLESCVVCGEFQRITRELDGVAFHHVFLDGAVGFDTEAGRLIDALMQVAAAAREVFGAFPFQSYTYIFSHSPQAHWGLEHPDCTMCGLGEHPYVDSKGWLDAVRVCAHELFHAWNVCRLKPAELAKASLVQPPNPDSLWVAEGVTRYYEFVLSARAGQLTAEQFFSNVVNYHRWLSAIPASARVSALDSSSATFLNHSRYPGSVNATIDYYDAGMLIAFALDARLRERGESLDARLARFYAAHAAEPDGYTHAQVVSELGDGEPLRREIEQPGALTTLARLESLGFEVGKQRVAYVGLVLAKDNAGPEIAHVLDTAPAATTGIAAGDVIQRVDGFPYTLKALKWLIERRQSVQLTVLRGHRTLEFTLPVAQREDVSSLTWRGTEAQLGLLRDWLKQPQLAWKPGRSVPLTAYDNFHGTPAVI